MKLEAGQKLGPYEIVSTLGVGGMGEVYRARDSRLDRDVAIKVLPQLLGTNPDALARFEREAKAVAALSHPNIMAIYDFGEHEGTAFAAVELLEGETLRDALAMGPLPSRKVIDYAQQAARGLGAAHESGIVHRDLKPENLFITRDGRVKILDFGLARTVGDASESMPDDTPTFTHLTGPGTVLGTINYMSPEQARGETAGPASDIFSLGSVLYEMLNGRRPFERETAPETMTAILRDDPIEVFATDPGANPAVQRIVQRCLEKRPEERFHSAHDLAFALETSSGVSIGVPAAADVPAKPRARRGWWPVFVALAIGVAMGALLNARLGTRSKPLPVKTTPVTFSGHDANPAASPDGRTLAFASRRIGAAGIWIKQLQGGGEAPLTRGDDNFPRISPDGATLLFTRYEAGNNSILRVPLVGGQPRKLLDDAIEADWSPDGSQVVFSRFDGADSSIGIANADGSGERILASLASSTITSPRWSPDGSKIAFALAPANNNVPLSVMLMDVESGEPRELPPKRPSLSGLAWSGDGKHLLFGWSEDLLSGLASSNVRMSIQDIAGGTTEDVFWTRDLLLTQVGARIDIAADGVVAFSTLNNAHGLHEVFLDGETGGEFRSLTSGLSVDRQPVYSPDGETILFSSNRSGRLDLWTLNTVTGAVRQLTDDEARDWDPAFSADGSRILWSSDRTGHLEIWIANADGSGARRVSDDGMDAENPSLTPDGEWVVYMSSNPDKEGMWKVRVDGTDATQLWEGAGFIPELSPDGKHVIFNVPEGSADTLMTLLDVESGETSTFARLRRGTTVSAIADGRARWFDDGNAIAFLGHDGDKRGVWVQDFVPGRDTAATRRKLASFETEWVTESFAVSADGKRAVLSRGREGGTVMLSENVPLVTKPRAN